MDTEEEMKKRLKALLLFTALSVILLMTLVSCFGGSSGGGGYDNYDEWIYITYYPNIREGGGVEQFSFSPDTLTPSFSTPEREGYTFAGLFTAKEGGDMYFDANGVAVVVISESMTLYAHWTPKSYTMAFNAGEGALVTNELERPVLAGSELSAFPMATRDGFEFIGYANAYGTLVSDGVTPKAEYARFELSSYPLNADGKAELTAVYTLKNCTVTFDYGDGRVETQTLAWGSPAMQIVYPTEDNGSSEIVSWSLSFGTQVNYADEVVKNDLTFYAIWRDYKTLVFHLGHGMDDIVERVYNGVNYKAPTPTRNGYAFSGWYSTDLFTGFPEQSISYYSFYTEFYAKWSLETYSVGFESYGGTGNLSPLSYNIENTLDLPTAEKEHCTFLGWCRNPDLSDEPMTVLPIGTYGNITLYAKYLGVTSMVTLDAGAGQLVSSAFNVEYSAFMQFPVPTYEGYIFCGWYLGTTQVSDGSGKSLSIWPYTEGGYTLTARYAKAYTVTVSINRPEGATLVMNSAYAEGDVVLFDLLLAEGWSLVSVQSNLGYAVEPGRTFTMPAKDLTFTVTVAPNTYRIGLVVDEGVYLKTTVLSVEMNAVITLPVPAYQGHSFLGWYYGNVQVTDESGRLLSENGWNIPSNAILTAQFVYDGNNYVFIQSAEDMQQVLNNPNGQFLLLSDIDLSSFAWWTIDFSGSFDGGGNTISGLRTALFGSLTGKLSNVTLQVNINTSGWSSQRYGAAVCDLREGGSVINVTVKGSIVYSGNADVGGLIGYVHHTNTTVTGCVNYASVEKKDASGWSVGGIVGAMGQCPRVFENNINYGNVSGPTGNAGGISGWCNSDGIVKHCENYGSRIYGQQAGGIIGTIASGTVVIDGCVSEGNIEGTSVSGKYVGQISGRVTYQNLPVVTVRNAAEFLAAVQNHVASEEIVLEGDIDLAGVQWTPVAFSGTLIGNGHRIKNLSLTSADQHVGLFTIVTGSVENVILSSFSIVSAGNSGCTRVGALCGEFKGVSIQNVTVESALVKAGCADCGGIIGYLSGGDVSDCVSYATVQAETTQNAGCIGGIAGYMPGGTINDCKNYGTVQGVYRVGGICGEMNIGGEKTSKNLVNYGNIIGESYVAGIFGSHNSGKLTLDAAANFGGVSATSSFSRYVARGTVTYVNLPVITITSAEQLQAMQMHIAEETYVLGANIDLSQFSWTPFDFTATLDGNGYKIIGLKNNLFNQITGNGTVKNLVLDGVNINVDGQGTVAALAFEIRNNAVVEQITIYGSLYARNASNVGGIVALAYNNTVFRGCTSYLNVDAVIQTGDRQIGGMLGAICSGHAVTLENCVNYGNVTGNHNVGGILGWYNGTVPVKNCSNYGTVTCAQRAGGIVGYAYRAVVIDGCGSYGEFGEGSTFGKYVCAGTATYQNLPVTDISTVQGLLDLKYNIKEETYRLTADIDLSGVSWTPFAFAATLDGNDHKISGLTLSASSGNLAMFTTVSGTVKNLTLENVNITSTSYEQVFVAGLAVEMNGGVLQKVTVSGIVTAQAGRVAGIVAKQSGGSISECVNYAAVKSAMTANDGSAGGVVAWFAGGSITGCQNYGKIEKKHYAGGVIGYMTALDATYLTNYGEVVGEYDTGGVVALFSYRGAATLNLNLVNAGSVTGVENVGGVFGWFAMNCYNSDAMSLNLLENTGTVNGEKRVGGVFGGFDIYADHYSDSILTATMSQISNSGNVTGKNEVGGIIGYGSTDSGSSRLNGCTSAAAVFGEYYVGGLAGKLNYVTLNECSNAGSTVTSTGYFVDNSNYLTYLGGYVGYGYGIIGCTNDVAITYTLKGSYIGGLAGYLSGNILSCYNNASITASKSSCVGGITGYCYRTSTETLYDLKNYGDIKGLDRTGGIAGQMYMQIYNSGSATLNAFENHGAITGGQYTGGVVGHFHADAYHYSDSAFCVSMTGFVNGGAVKGTSYVGGLIGFGETDHSDSSISDSASSGAIEAEYYVGGLAGYLNLVAITASSNEGSTVTATGYFVENSVYYTYLGGYVGRGYAVSGCTNATAITYALKGSNIGGIAGYATGSISSCTNTGKITASRADRVGGLVGHVAIGASTCEHNVNEAEVKGADYVGGLFGYFKAQTYDSTTIMLNDFKNSGAVSGAQYTAGILGYFTADAYHYNSSTLRLNATGLHNTGNVTGTAYVGGIFGYGYTDDGNSLMLDSSSSGAIEAEYYVGGLAGYLDYIQMNSCLNEGVTVTATGYFVDGSTYYTYLGGYAGRGYIITECENAADISYLLRGSYVGGIAGYAYGAFSSCTNSGSIYAPSCDAVGGIVGYAYIAGGATIEGNRNTGAVTGNNRVGGIVGMLYGNAYDSCTLTMKKQNNTGTVTGNQYVGGIAGEMNVNAYHYNSSTMTITASELNNMGDVTGAEHVGGLAGYVYTDSGSSALTGYSSVGTVSGSGSYTSETFAQTVNFKINA